MKKFTNKQKLHIIHQHAWIDEDVFEKLSWKYTDKDIVKKEVEYILSALWKNDSAKLKNITIWEPFENWDVTFLADHIFCLLDQ